MMLSLLLILTPSFGFGPPDSGAIDWRTKGATTPVANEGQGGSSTVAAMVEVMAAYVAINSGRMPPMLSPGMLADCSFCKGGSAFESAQSLWKCADVNFGGVCSEADYPAATGKCPRAGQCSNAFSTKGLKLAPLLNETAMTKAATQGVLVAAVDASNMGFMDYSSGIYMGKTCTEQVDHYLTVVGYNAASPAYWILQNSWGADWGNNGYMYLHKGTADTCGIYVNAFAIQKQ